MDAAQIYETTIFDRDSALAFSFATIPADSLENREAPSVERAARVLGLRSIQDDRAAAERIEPVEPWLLPFVIDAALGRYPDGPYDFPFYLDPYEPRRRRRRPSPFAQYLTYAEVIPFESSPLGAKALAALVTGTTTAGATLGYAAAGEPTLLVTVPAGIIVAGASIGIGAGTAIGLAEGVRYRLRRLMGVPDDEPPAAPEPVE